MTNNHPNRYLKAFVHEGDNVTSARAGFQFPRDAFDYVAAHDERSPATSGAWIVKDANGRRITGTTAHGDAILDILKRHDEAAS